jgi:Peroxiredoxin
VTRRLSLLAVAFSLLLPAWAAEIPRPAPAMTIPLVNGTKISLDQYKGKVLAVEFLLTTCPACQRASQALNKVYNEYRSRGFEAVGVAINPMAHMLIPEYVERFKINFPIGYNENQDQVKGFLQHPVIQIMKVPQLVFIDRTGVIRAQYSGVDPFFSNEEANMRAQVEKLLSEPVAKAAAGKKK